MYRECRGSAGKHERRTWKTKKREINQVRLLSFHLGTVAAPHHVRIQRIASGAEPVVVQDRGIREMIKSNQIKMFLLPGSLDVLCVFAALPWCAPDVYKAAERSSSIALICTSSNQ